MRSLPWLRRCVLPVTVLAAATAGTLAAAPPAAADVTGTTSTGDVVLYQECQRHDIDYDLSVGGFLQPPWRVTIQVFDPDGFTSEQSVLNSASNPPLSGTVTKIFCGSEKPGTWTVKGIVSYSPFDVASADLPETTFMVRAPRTTTSLKKRHLAPQKNRLVAKVRQETPTGWGRADGVPLKLEKLVDGEWQQVRRVLTTASKGRAATVVRGRGTYRVVLPARSNLDGSASRGVRVR